MREIEPLVEDFDDLERLLGLLGVYDIAIIECGGLKIVRNPSVQQPNMREAAPELPSPPNLYDDPDLYPDGVVPRFNR